MGVSDKNMIVSLDGSTVVMVQSLAFRFEKDPVTCELSVSYTSTMFAEARQSTPWAICEPSSNPALHGPGSSHWTFIRRVAVYSRCGWITDPGFEKQEEPEWRFRLRFSEPYDGLLPAKVAAKAEEAYQVYVKHQIESE